MFISSTKLAKMLLTIYTVYAAIIQWNLMLVYKKLKTRSLEFANNSLVFNCSFIFLIQLFIMSTNHSNDYEEFETPAQVYNRLIQLVSNEIQSPEVLPYEQAIVDCIVDQIQHMNDNIKKLQNKLDPFCVEQHKIELERYGYVVNKYLRTRIEKIESQAASLIKVVQSNTNLASKLMSRHEIKHLDNYVSGIDNYLNQSVLSRLQFSPTPVMSFKLVHIESDDENIFENTYVFVRALKQTQMIIEDKNGQNQEIVELEKGTQHFLPYNAVRRHLVTGSKDLLLI